MKKICLFLISLFAIAGMAKAQTCADSTFTYFNRASANYIYTLDTGFIFGPNLYTKEVGNNYDIATAQLKGVLIVFDQKKIIGSADSFSVNVYNTNPVDSLPTGNAIATTKISSSDMDTNFSSSSNFSSYFTYVQFPSPVTVSRNYAITVQVFGTGINDSFAIGASAQADGLGERRSLMKAGNNAWYHMGEFWTTGSAGLDVDALMVPVLQRGFSALATANAITSCPGSTVQLSATTFSCNGTVNVSWSGPGITNPSSASTTATIPSNATDSVVYTLTATDPTTNVTSVSKVKVLVSTLSVSAGADVVLACGATNTNLTATVADTNGLTIQWTGGHTGLTYPHVGVGTYVINVTGAAGCHASDTVKVTSATNQQLSFTSRSYYNGNIDTATFSPCETVPVRFTNTSTVLTGWNWSWSTSSGGIASTANFTNTFLQIGSDTVFLSADSAGCHLQSVHIVSVLPSSNTNCIANSLYVTVTGNTSICPGNSTTLTAHLHNAVAPLTIQWSNGGTLDSTTVSSAGTYNVTVTDVNGSATASIAVTTNSVCDSVWPGDADHNGIADANDVLQIGIEYGSTGPVRSGATQAWVPQAAANWSGYTYGINDKHADSDGNGVIDVNDTLAVSLNFGLTHQKNGLRATPSDPLLQLVPTADTILAGSTFALQVLLGTSALPVDSLYGLAFSFSIDPIVFDTSAASISLANSWMGNSANTITFRKLINGQGVIALTRNNHTDGNGNGEIATLTLKANANLPSGVATVNVDFAPTVIKGVTARGVVHTYNVQSNRLVITDTTTGIVETAIAQHISLYPNPSNGHFTLSINQASKTLNIELLNIQGQQMYTEQLKDVTSLQKELNLTDLAKGVYLLKVSTENGVGVKRVVVQ